jgi:hypothetical protein
VGRSQANLDAATATDTLAINPIIYSELSIAFARIEELEAVIARTSLSARTLLSPIARSSHAMLRDTAPTSRRCNLSRLDTLKVKSGSDRGQ